MEKHDAFEKYWKVAEKARAAGWYAAAARAYRRCMRVYECPSSRWEAELHLISMARLVQVYAAGGKILEAGMLRAEAAKRLKVMQLEGVVHSGSLISRILRGKAA